MTINQALKSPHKAQRFKVIGPHLSIAMVRETRTHRVKCVIHIEPQTCETNMEFIQALKSEVVLKALGHFLNGIDSWFN